MGGTATAGYGKTTHRQSQDAAEEESFGHTSRAALNLSADQDAGMTMAATNVPSSDYDLGYTTRRFSQDAVLAPSQVDLHPPVASTQQRPSNTGIFAATTAAATTKAPSATLLPAERAWPEKQYFPFELTNEDYAHRTLDLIDAIILKLFKGAVNNGIIPSIPTSKVNHEVETSELLHYAQEWPEPLGPRGVLLQYLFGNQSTITHSHVFRVCFDNHMDKIIVGRTAIVTLLANRQRVSREIVVGLLDQVVSLAIILNDHENWSTGERLAAQFDQHWRSKTTRLQVGRILGMMVGFKASEAIDKECVMVF